VLPDSLAAGFKGPTSNGRGGKGTGKEGSGGRGRGRGERVKEWKKG